jgi:hypothetical protein
LEGHLENEAQRERSPDAARDSERRVGSGKSAAPFNDDFQLRLAYQTLRAISLDRERRKP